MYKLRVWVVTPELHRLGGTERSLAEQIERWRGRFDLSLYAMRVHGVELGGVRVRRLWRPPGPHLLRYIWWVAVNHLVRWWDRGREGSPDVVCSAGVNCFDARAIGVHVVFGNLLEVAHSVPSRDMLSAGSAARRIHRSLLGTVLRSIEHRVYTGPATLWTVSRRDARGLEVRFDRPPGSIPVVPQGVDARGFSPTARLVARDDSRRRRRVEGRKVALLVGNDWSNKGLAAALRALALLPRDYMLAVAGRDDAGRFLRLAEQVGVVDRVIFLPRTDDILEYYAAADCLVAPSRWDAFHMPALEAMACGLPVIVSAKAGVSEVVEDGREALVLTDPEDHETLARLVRRVFEEPGLAERLSHEGRMLAERCSWDVNAERAAELIEQEARTPRVLLLAPDPWGTGGIERATRTLIQALADLYGPERVGLLSVWGPTPDAVELPCRVLHAGPGRPGVGTSARVGLGRKAKLALAALWSARRWRGRKLVIVACHTHLAPVAWGCRAVSGAAFAVWCHGQEAWGKPRPTVRFALPRARAILAGSRFTAEAVRAILRGRAPAPIVAPYALAGEVRPPRNGGTTRPGASGRHVLAVARLNRGDAYKGVETLLLAWPEVQRRLPDAELNVIGEGDDRSRLERLAQRLGVGSRVRFDGRVGDEVLVEAYASSTVFALPGRARLGPNPAGEGFGLVFLEAAAAGLPCVAGRAGGALEAVEDGVTGFLVDPEKPHEVAAAVLRLLEDPDLARRMGEAGRARITRDFLYERFRDRIGEFIGSLVEE